MCTRFCTWQEPSDWHKDHVDVKWGQAAAELHMRFATELYREQVEDGLYFLREHLGRQTRILFSPAHLSRLMADNGIVYRRPKHGMAHLRDSQEYDEKKAFLEFIKKGRCVQKPPLTCSTSMSVRFTSTQP